MPDNDVAIRVEDVTKSFKMPHERYNSLKQNAIHIFSKKSYSKFEAVKKVGFEVKRGEFFGIVGRNGSGKSTLLKMLAGIYTPTSGKVIVNGSLSPFIELGVGFNPELSARDNVFLNGAVLGMSRKQIQQKFDEIIGFAELEEFVDQKLKNYSSGMQVRLAFSIAIQAQSDILLIDEVLAVGDANFQQKCSEVFLNLKKEGKTIVLVTHDMGAVIQFCDRVVMLSKGKLVDEGKPVEIAEKYRLINYEPTEAPESQEGGESTVNGIRLSDVQVMTTEGKPEHYFQPGDKLRVSFKYHNSSRKALHFGFQIMTEDEVYCFGTNTKISGQAAVKAADGEVTVELQPPLQGGNYYITLAALNAEATTIVSHYIKASSFRIAQLDEFQGLCRVDHTWSINV